LTASLTFAADRPVLLLSSAAAGENERITVNIAIAKIVVIAPLRVLSLLFIWVSLLAEFHQEVGVLIRGNYTSTAFPPNQEVKALRLFIAPSTEISRSWPGPAAQSGRSIGAATVPPMTVARRSTTTLGGLVFTTTSSA
jgi:hypothetical protein